MHAGELLRTTVLTAWQAAVSHERHGLGSRDGDAARDNSACGPVSQAWRRRQSGAAEICPLSVIREKKCDDPVHAGYSLICNVRVACESLPRKRPSNRPGFTNVPETVAMPTTGFGSRS
jgi:hypothetical protein